MADMAELCEPRRGWGPLAVSVLAVTVALGGAELQEKLSHMRADELGEAIGSSRRRPESVAQTLWIACAHGVRGFHAFVCGLRGLRAAERARTCCGRACASGSCALSVFAPLRCVHCPRSSL